jgi:hypothetical protein
MAAFVDGQELFTRLSQQQTEESNHAYTTSYLKAEISILDRWWGVEGFSDQGKGADEW